MIWSHVDLTDRALKQLLMAGAIRYAGNKKLRIYGKLGCASGKRMKRVNRVFISSGKEALDAGYRPCKKCMLNRLHRKHGCPTKFAF